MLCWLQVTEKSCVLKSITRKSLTAVKDLTYEGSWRVGPEQWRRNINHVRDKVEDHY